MKISSTDLPASEKRDFHSRDGRPLGKLRPEFAGKTGWIIGGSSGIGKAVGRLLLEKRAEAGVIAGKNKKKLLSAEVELVLSDR